MNCFKEETLTDTCASIDKIESLINESMFILEKILLFIKQETHDCQDIQIKIQHNLRHSLQGVKEMRENLLSVISKISDTEQTEE